MTKRIIDYSNTIIYKICCKDSSIIDNYVGHTTNFIKRKYQHQVESKNKHNTCKLYQTIRNNGGWENWDMIILQEFKCANINEARIKEQEYYLLLKPSLNSVQPFVCKKIDNQYISEDENIIINDTSIKTNKYNCENCNFHTDNKKDYNKHVETIKHKNIVDFDKKSKPYTCEKCDKEYMSRNGLWFHKKKCAESNKNICNNEIFMILCKQNNEIKEIKEIILEQNTQILFLLQDKLQSI